MTTTIWDNYRVTYDNIQASGRDAALHKQLFEVGAAIVDENYPLAVQLTEELVQQTASTGEVTLGWAPNMAADALLAQIKMLAD